MSEVHGVEFVHAGTKTVVRPDAAENQQGPNTLISSGYSLHRIDAAE